MPSIHHHSAPFVDLDWLAHADCSWETGYGVDLVGSVGGAPVVALHGMGLASAEALAAELLAAVRRVREFDAQHGPEARGAAGTPRPEASDAP